MAIQISREERESPDRRPRYTRYAEQMLRQGWTLTLNHIRKTATFRRSTDAGYYTIPHRAAVEALGGVDSELLGRVVELGKRPAAPEPPPPSPYEVKPKAKKKKKKKPDPKPAPAPKPVRAQTPKEAPPQEEIMITKTVALEKKRYLVRELAGITGLANHIFTDARRLGRIDTEKRGGGVTSPLEVIANEKLAAYLRPRGVEIELRAGKPKEAAPPKQPNARKITAIVGELEKGGFLPKEEPQEFGLRAVADNGGAVVQSLNGKRAHADRPVVKRIVTVRLEVYPFGISIDTDHEGKAVAVIDGFRPKETVVMRTDDLRKLSALLEAAAKEMEGHPAEVTHA